MSKEYFVPVDFDALYPPPTPPSSPSVPSPEANQAKAEAVYAAVREINLQLIAIRTGQSNIIKQAIQFTPEKTPFCITLERVRTMDKQENLTKAHVLQLVALARQDFGETFATFVLEQFKPVFAGGK
jgi:hypothetical protein